MYWINLIHFKLPCRYGGIISGFLSILSALASLNRIPFCSDGDNVELIVIVLLIWLVRALSRRLVFFNLTTSTIAVNISKIAPNIPSNVPMKGFICRKVGFNTDGSSTSRKTSEQNWENKTWASDQRKHVEITDCVIYQFVFLHFSLWKLVIRQGSICLFYCKQQQQCRSQVLVQDFWIRKMVF